MHTLERLGVFSGHSGSSVLAGGDKGKRGNVLASNQQNANNRQLSIHNRATMAKTLLNLIAFVQKQAPVIGLFLII